MQNYNINYEGLKINAWPFKEAQKLLKRLNYKTPSKGYILFETGYGPSGMPHIGTFGEVARTVMVMKALNTIAPHIPLKLFAYSDDLDGLRKVPDNVPNPEKLKEYIGFPLSKIPDPFGKFESYAAYMNNKLKQFLDHFGFEYELHSASTHYNEGKYNEILKKTLQNTEKILQIMLPSLGEERQKNYHPFLPISQKTGQFCFDGVKSYNTEEGTICFINNLGEEENINIYNGNCKLQWKIDWAMRWAALGVDYEMHGKDLTPTAVLSAQICKILGSIPPQLYVYELFTDELGQKISKSKGNGVSIDEWLRYGTEESLALFMYDNPHSSKRLFLRNIPKYIDEYINHAKNFSQLDYTQQPELQFNNPVFYLPVQTRKISTNFKVDFGLITNLASVCNSTDPNILIEYVKKYQPNLTTDEEALVSELVNKALNFYQDFIAPNKKYLSTNENHKNQLQQLHTQLQDFFKINQYASEEEIQNQFYAIAKNIGYDKSNMKEWFLMLYQILFGQDHGPKFGSFIKIFGKDNFLELIKNQLHNN